jgi:hypothetical protein
VEEEWKGHKRGIASLDADWRMLEGMRLRGFDRTPTQNDVVSPVSTFDEDGVRFRTMRKRGKSF